MLRIRDKWVSSGKAGGYIVVTVTLITHCKYDFGKRLSMLGTIHVVVVNKNSSKFVDIKTEEVN